MDERLQGQFEELVLLAILALGNEAYGVPIRRLIEKETARGVSIGALYTALDRLETKGFVSSRMGYATPERGGRAKKFFRVEGAGQRALDLAEQERLGLRVLQSAGGTM